MLYTDGTLIEAVNAGEDTPETIADPITGKPAFAVAWKSTDAWRGFYDTTPIAESYSVWRHFQEDGKPKQLILSGVTRDEAVAHCSDPSTKGDDWFDGWEEDAPIAWEKVDEGWLTGDWDDAPAGHSESEVKAKLDKLAEDADILVVFAPSSNVFSTTYDCFLRRTKAED
jgi:hypothetical protein